MDDRLISNIGLSKCTNSIADDCNSTNMLENIRQMCSDIVHWAREQNCILMFFILLPYIFRGFILFLLSHSFFLLLGYLTGYGLILLHRDSGTMLLHVLGRQQLLQLKNLGSEIYTIQQVLVLKGNLLI